MNALRHNRRWFALCCGLIAAQCVVSLVVRQGGAGLFPRYLVSLPFAIGVLVILRRVSDEAQLARATQTGSGREPQL